MTAVVSHLIPPAMAESSTQRENIAAPGDGDLSRPSSPSPGWVARPLILLVRCYQAVRHGRPSPCRYLPTCSAYAIEAVQRHGAGRGSWLAVRRLGRCHPWGGHGADPVPE